MTLEKINIASENKNSPAELIMENLKFFSKPFPFEWVLKAIDAKEEITPLLLDSLSYAIKTNDSLDEEYFGHMYALYILAQFKEPRAYYATLKLLELPGETLYNLIGDSLTENVGRILASTYDGKVLLLLNVAKNKKLYLYARTAALDAIAILFFNDLISRENIVSYFESVMDSLDYNKDGKWGDDNEIWAYIAYSCLELGLEEHKDRINKAFDDDVVDLTFVSKEEFNEISSSQQIDSYKQYSVIDDICDEMSQWHCFKEGEDDEYDEEFDFDFDDDFEELLENYEPDLQAKNVTPKMGRNDPCACGSGLKYKKCCL